MNDSTIGANVGSFVGLVAIVEVVRRERNIFWQTLEQPDVRGTENIIVGIRKLLI